MARSLHVYLYRDRVGDLVQDDHGEMTFQYADGWLANDHAAPLSQSLPLRHEAYSRRECVAFFNGVLPEGAQRERIAQNLGISARNDFTMLEGIGGECAGAVTFLLPGASLPPDLGAYRPLTEAELAGMLRRLPLSPFLAGDAGVRLSLAGAQGKLPVHAAAGAVSVPLDGAPSTHILKPGTAALEGLVFNEFICMRLAKAAGLPVADVELGRAEEIDYLLVSRYDREEDGSGALVRVHQEDFCQALGIVSDRKYQSEGGPSVAQCVELLRRACTAPARDIVRFVDAVIFNMLIGNSDAHGKNHSLLYVGHPPAPRVTALAPLYDLVCTAAYPHITRRMAMKIGGEYDAERLCPRHFDQLADEARLGKPRLRRRVRELAERVMGRLSSVTPEHGAGARVGELIRRRCAYALDLFRV